MAASSTAVRRRVPARSRFWTRLGIVALAALAVVVALPLFFAGSPDRLPDGTRIAGVDVGGLSTSDAKALLSGRAARLAQVPVTFTAGGGRFDLTARELGVRVDWGAAVDAAKKQAGGVGIVRGYKRLSLTLFPSQVVPTVHSYRAAVDYELARIAKAVDTPHREARLVRRGLHVTIAPGKTGRVLDRAAARQAILAALASFSRAPVALPARVDSPRVTVRSLAAKQRVATTIISAPVTLVAGPTRLRVPRWRLALLLDLATLRFGGKAADTYFAQLERQVDRAPKDATFAVLAGGRVRVVPAESGTSLDVPRSADRILAAAKRPIARTARLALVAQAPGRSTAEAQAMGITGTVGSYETLYGGEPNRIHNVELVAHLVDNKLIAPGATFSFNGTTGERSAAKGFLEAPVIVNGELQTGLGGGVCQVSTTVFNAAYEAGLRITARTNHSLYISHYPLGRDATVDYPSVDLKFVNDTGHWLLLRTWVGPSSLTVGLYGTPQHRRVETVAQPLRVVAPPPVQKTVDATLKPGETVVDDPGVPAQSTSVERKVYAPNGNLLSDETWYSSYRAEPKIVRVGPKAKHKPAKKTTTTATNATTTTAPTTTSQSPPATTTVPG
jgi:vancomycin resistance protein YoaR